MKLKHAAFFLIWLFIVLMGFSFMERYVHRAGKAGPSPESWPSQSRIPFSVGRPMFVLFVHPLCACSVATFGELERLMVNFRGRIDVRIVFSGPLTDEATLAQSSVWQKSRQLKGADVFVDRDEREAKLFGAMTSGQTYLFDSNGKRVFAGGITPSRGHQGDSEGRLAILHWLETNHILLATSKSYGCSLSKTSREPTSEAEP